MKSYKISIKKIVIIFCIIQANWTIHANWPRTRQQNALLFACMALEYEHKDRSIKDGYSFFLENLQITLHKRNSQITRSAIRRIVDKIRDETTFELEDKKRLLRKEFIKKIKSMPTPCLAEDFENAYHYITEESRYDKKTFTDFYYQKTLEFIEQQEEAQEEVSLPVLQPLPAPTTITKQKNNHTAKPSTGISFPNINKSKSTEQE